MPKLYPDHKAQLNRLNRIEGQIRGIHKMIDDRRYCIDIVQQIKAVQAALKQVQMGILETHIHHCVVEAAESDDARMLDEKITEVVQVVGKME